MGEKHDNVPGTLPLVRKIVSTGLHNTLPPVNQLLKMDPLQAATAAHEDQAPRLGTA